MAYTITMGGQDITSHVQSDIQPIVAKDILGQGAGGAGATRTGRAATCEFLTDLGPANSALGAGQSLPPKITNIYPAYWARCDSTAGAQTYNTTVVTDPTEAVDVNGISLKSTTLGTNSYEYVWLPLDASLLAASTTYTLSFYLLGASGTVRAYMQSNVTNIGAVNTYTLTNAWTRHSVTFTTAGPLGFTSAGLRIDTGGSNQAITFWVDDIQLETGSTANNFIVGTTPPSLQRKAEVIITDANGNNVFGGYSSVITDRTINKNSFTDVQCVDYWQDFDSIQVQEIYSGVSDVFIIRDLITKYAPHISLHYMPTYGSYTFTVRVLKAITLQKALAAITDVTGWQIFTDGLKHIFYNNPIVSSTAFFSLSSNPNNITSFPFGVDPTSGLVIDDTAVINRATFFGGKNPSNDFTQDLSTQANGSNRLFVLAFYPRVASSGVFVITSGNLNNGNALTYGYILGSTNKNKFKSQGGLADVLLNSDARTINFDPGAAAPVNSGAGSVTMTYRYEFPMVIQITDKTSHTFFGRWYDGVISDNTVFDRPTAVARLRTLLAEQSKGLTTLKVSCWKGGLQAGQLLNVYHSARNINGTYMIQEVDATSLGNGLFRYDVVCGAWNYNVIDSILTATQAAYQAGLAPVNDDTNGQTTSVLEIIQQGENLGVHDVWTSSTRTWGGYYANATPQNDGTDAYAGLFTVAT